MASTGWVWVSQTSREFSIPTTDTCRGKNTVLAAVP